MNVPEDFWGIHRCSTCAVERRRSQLLAFLAGGKSNQEVLTQELHPAERENIVPDSKT